MKRMTLAIVCLVFVCVLWAATGYYGFNVRAGRCIIGIQQGALWYQTAADPIALSGHPIGFFAPSHRTLLLWPRFQWATGYSFAILPLWIPLVLPAVIAIATLCFGWRAERHRCGKCGYDLRGKTSGRCPECGALSTRTHSEATASSNSMRPPG